MREQGAGGAAGQTGRTRPSEQAGPTVRGVLSDYAEAVLDVVDQVPPGSVTTYGRVAAVLSEAGLGGSARSVGMVMAAYGAAVAWWRVIPADGSPPVHDPAGALARWRDEGVPLRPEPSTGRARAGRVRADLSVALAEVRAPDWARP